MDNYSLYIQLSYNKQYNCFYRHILKISLFTASCIKATICLYRQQVNLYLYVNAGEKLPILLFLVLKENISRYSLH